MYTIDNLPSLTDYIQAQGITYAMIYAPDETLAAKLTEKTPVDMAQSVRRWLTDRPGTYILHLKEVSTHQDFNKREVKYQPGQSLNGTTSAAPADLEARIMQGVESRIAEMQRQQEFNDLKSELEQARTFQGYISGVLGQVIESFAKKMAPHLMPEAGALAGAPQHGPIVGMEPDDVASEAMDRLLRVASPGFLLKLAQYAETNPAAIGMVAKIIGYHETETNRPEQPIGATSPAESEND